jgi:hypothetical protein
VDEFHIAYTNWISAQFPSGSSSDPVDELHAELVRLDALVAEAVIPLSSGRRFDPGSVDLVVAIKDLQRHIRDVALLEVGGRTRLDEYARYAELLRQVYVAAAAAAGR